MNARAVLIRTFSPATALAAITLLGCLCSGLPAAGHPATKGWQPLIAAKIFAAGHAFFTGVIFVTIVGIVLVPMFHPVLHKFHLE